MANAQQNSRQPVPRNSRQPVPRNSQQPVPRNSQQPVFLCVRGGTAEVTEKRSRFIGQTLPVQTEEEAQAFIARIRKENRDRAPQLLRLHHRTGGQRGKVLR